MTKKSKPVAPRDPGGKVSLRLPVKMLAELRLVALARMTTVSDLLRLMIIEAMPEQRLWLARNGPAASDAQMAQLASAILRRALGGPEGVEHALAILLAEGSAARLSMRDRNTPEMRILLRLLGEAASEADTHQEEDQP